LSVCRHFLITLWDSKFIHVAPKRSGWNKTNAKTLLKLDRESKCFHVINVILISSKIKSVFQMISIIYLFIFSYFFIFRVFSQFATPFTNRLHRKQLSAQTTNWRSRSISLHISIKQTFHNKKDTKAFQFISNRVYTCNIFIIINSNVRVSYINKTNKIREYVLRYWCKERINKCIKIIEKPLFNSNFAHG